jgi:hypothetical protein
MEGAVQSIVRGWKEWRRREAGLLCAVYRPVVCERNKICLHRLLSYNNKRNKALTRIHFGLVVLDFRVQRLRFGLALLHKRAISV